MEYSITASDIAKRIGCDRQDIHATGCDCFVDGEWVTEYEDGIYEDAPGCVYEDEEDDEPEWTEEDETQYAETFEPYPGFENFKLGGK